MEFAPLWFALLIPLIAFAVAIDVGAVIQLTQDSMHRGRLSAQ